MKEIFEKITSYNLFNYLLPGVLFVVILSKFTSYSFIQDNLITGAFVYYFIGLIISRFGSLVIEPILKKISFLKFAKYEDFVSASKKDPSIDAFSEINNMYRTFVAMFILVGLIRIYQIVEFKFSILAEWSPYILILLLFIMFILSYKKQTDYIRKRIKFLLS
jgi:hypothetical protein